MKTITIVIGGAVVAGAAFVVYRVLTARGVIGTGAAVAEPATAEVPANGDLPAPPASPVPQPLLTNAALSQVFNSRGVKREPPLGAPTAHPQISYPPAGPAVQVYDTPGSTRPRK